MIESKLKEKPMNCNRGQLFRPCWVSQHDIGSDQLSMVALLGFQFGLYPVPSSLQTNWQSKIRRNNLGQLDTKQNKAQSSLY